MITLYKPTKEFYKLENGDIIGGKVVSAQTEQQLKEFKEFNNIDEAYEYFGVEKPEEDINIPPQIITKNNLQHKFNLL